MKEYYQSASKAPAAVLLELVKKHDDKQKGLVPDDLNPLRTAEGVASNANFERLSHNILDAKRSESGLEEPSAI